MHRADRYADRPPQRRPDRRDPLPARGGPASSLLQPPDPGPAPLMPRRARVTIRGTPSPAPRRPGTWIGSYRIHPLDVITVMLGIAVLLAVFWQQ